MFQDLLSKDVEETETFVKNCLPDILAAALQENDISYGKIELTWFFGAFSTKPQEFIFLPDEKEAIFALSTHVKKTVDESGVDHFVNSSTNNTSQNILCESVFGLVFGSKEREFLNFTEFESTNNRDKNQMQADSKSIDLLPLQPIVPLTQTHVLLKKMQERADINHTRTKPGYRFDEDTKRFCTYVRLIAGRLAYATIHRNLELSIPSLSTTNLYARNKCKHIFDGCLRTNELLEYLIARNLPLVVSISEDATRIDGRIQYCSMTNQILGFVSPINSNTGMPIPNSFPAKSYMEIVKHFSSDNSPAENVNVVMAQPLAKFPPFCLLLYGTDTKYTAEDVINRWDYIVKELSKINIKVLTVSSDSDPRYNSAMRKRSFLGDESPIFKSKKWFSSGLCEQHEGPFDMQDLIHILTKMRNAFMKTIRHQHRFSFGNSYIQMNHLIYLLNHFPRDQHCLTKSTLDPVDRQNYSSVLRMCSDKVIRLLKTKVPNSQGTIKFLTIMRNIIEAFSDNNFSPMDRIYKIWYSLFMLRIWRRFVMLKKNLTLKENFLTHYTYSCIELNAHNLVLIIMFLSSHNMSELFLPFLYSSQPCEEFFRRIRSFTSILNKGKL